MATNKSCKAIASASGDRCKRKAVEDGYCKQHHNQMYPKADAEIATREEVKDVYVEGLETGMALTEPTDPVFAKYEIAKRVAHTLAQSNLVPDAYRGRPNDVFVAINMGSELGMEPFQAIQSIAVIEGKPCLYGDGLIGVVRASPKCLWIKETISDDGKIATCETQRRDDPETISATYTWSDAVQAGIESKFNWKKHPKRMLQMRARAYCLRDAYPDLLKGLGVVEERQDHEDSPPPITEYVLPDPPPATTLPEQPKDQVTLAQVERAINQSDTMAELLAAGQMAKGLTAQRDIGTAKITYKRMRTALQETET